MRLPNGYGSVYKLSGNRRRPFIARVTTGWSDEGKQLCATVGYFKTKKEALQALADYNDNPYDVVQSRLTFADVYNKWGEVFFTEDMNRSTKKSYTNAYKFCTSLYDMNMVDIKLTHLQNAVDSSGAGADTKHRMKILFNKMYDYCIKHEYLTKNYAELVTLPKYETRSKRTAISNDDINLIWNTAPGSYAAKVALILIYSGVRINELLNLKLENVHLDEQYFDVVQSKTFSGVRVVPIADKALPFWREITAMSECEYAITNNDGKRMTDDNFRRRYWHPLMSDLGLDYTIHETRHTCISLLTAANVNQTLIKHIVGHKAIMSLTEAVYTHFELQTLLDAINLI